MLVFHLTFGYTYENITILMKILYLALENVYLGIKQYFIIKLKNTSLQPNWEKMSFYMMTIEIKYACMMWSKLFISFFFFKKKN